MTTPSAGPGLSLQDGLEQSGMSIDELWLRQVSVGGNAGSLETEAYLVGLLVADPHQYDLLAQALNEHFVELGQDHPVGYWSAAVGG
jgi:hypothetical protein